MKFYSLKLLQIIAGFIFYIFYSHGASAQCVRIESILVDACDPGGASVEKDNELLIFRVGPNALNTSNLTMTFGVAPFPGLVSPNATTAGKVAQINASIQSCGFLKEPINGVLPANSKVLMIGSPLIDVASNPFTNLSDTLIVIFFQIYGGDAFFINAPGPIPPPNAQTTTISFGGSCTNSVTYLRSQLVNQSGTPGIAQDGAAVDFDANGNPTYYNNGCLAPVQSLSAEWNNPSPLCQGNQTINLNNLITGTSGGTWSGPGVTGSQLNLTGLSGNISVTYSISIPGCGFETETKVIQLVDCCKPVSFNNIPTSVNCSAAPINLMANQAGFAPNEAITPCYFVEAPTLPGHTGLSIRFLENGTLIGTINVTPNTNFSGYYSFASPNANNQVQLCEPASAALAGNIPFTIRDCHSNAILTSGIWIMDGNCQTVGVTPPGNLSGTATWTSNSNGLINVTDWGAAQFSPAAAGPGAWTVTYCWDSQSGCQGCQTQNITVTSNNNANWTNPGTICANQTNVNFNTFITGNQGGT